jgi:hypothetical protein
MVMPAHLCQLNSRSRSGEIGRSAMYTPSPKMPNSASASSQCSTIAGPL